MKLNPEVKNIFDFRFEDFSSGELSTSSFDQSPGSCLNITSHEAIHYCCRMLKTMPSGKIIRCYGICRRICGFSKIPPGDFPLIMGRKTFEALGSKPLAGRFNIVVSRSLVINQETRMYRRRIVFLKLLNWQEKQIQRKLLLAVADKFIKSPFTK